MDAQTLRSKTPELLAQELIDAQKRMKELRFKVASNQLKDVREIRELKRAIARMKTILSATT